jgi:hypothetical protein
METIEKLRILKGQWMTRVQWGKQNRTLKVSLVLGNSPGGGLVIEACVPWLFSCRWERLPTGTVEVGEDVARKECSLEVTKTHLEVVAGEYRSENTWFNGSIFLFRWQRLKWNNDIYQKHLRQVVFTDVVFFPQEDLELITSEVRLAYHRRYRIDRTPGRFPIRREKWVSATITPAVPTRTGHVSKIIIPSKRRFDKTQSDLQTLAHVVKHIALLREA